MKTYYYYDKSKWDEKQLCYMKVAEPLLTVNANSITEADKMFENQMGFDVKKVPMIVATLNPIWNQDGTLNWGIMQPLILPLEQAVIAAAYQNMITDQENDPDTEVSWDIYMEEAEYLMKNTGENYQPPSGQPLIKVQ